jgi:NAD(P)-dependent dehydrogenase (short-subunit alcohol dehydrogenase family)
MLAAIHRARNDALHAAAGAASIAASAAAASMAAMLLAAGLAAAPTVPAHADTVLITGSNSGIGLELAKEYAAAGWDVIATHRRSSVPETLAALKAEHDNVRIETLDVTDQPGIAALAEKLRGVPIDVLINNAGVYNDRSGCETDDCPGNWRTQDFGNLRYPLFDTILAVNVKGPLMVTEAFIDNVKASHQKKVVSISSTNGSVTYSLGGSGAIFYRASKAALNREMQLVAESQRGAGVIVVLLHPGAVLTERQAYLSGYEGLVTMQESVEGMIKVIDGLTLDDAGRFIQYDGTTAPW